MTNSLKWNFTKFLLVDGVPLKRFGTKDDPLSFEGDIVDALATAKQRSGTAKEL